jgi:translation elongation factor P/translation initiation factor 5A
MSQNTGLTFSERLKKKKEGGVTSSGMTFSERAAGMGLDTRKKSEKTLTGSLDKMFPHRQMIRNVSNPNYQPLVLPKSKAQQQEENLKKVEEDRERGVTISQGQPKEISLIRKLVRAIPGDSRFEKSLERDVLDPIAKVSNFIFPTKQDYLREAAEINPKASTEEIYEIAQGLMLKDGYVPISDDLAFSPIDTFGPIALGTKGKAGFNRLIRRIRSAKNPTEANTIAREFIPNNTSRELVEQIMKAKSDADAQKAIQSLVAKSTPPTSTITPPASTVTPPASTITPPPSTATPPTPSVRNVITPQNATPPSGRLLPSAPMREVAQQTSTPPPPRGEPSNLRQVEAQVIPQEIKTVKQILEEGGAMVVDKRDVTKSTAGKGSNTMEVSVDNLITKDKFTKADEVQISRLQNKITENPNIEPVAVRVVDGAVEPVTNIGKQTIEAARRAGVDMVPIIEKVNPAQRPGIIRSAINNLRNPAMRQGGYAGKEVPEGMRRTPTPDNQRVSSANDSTPISSAKSIGGDSTSSTERAKIKEIKADTKWKKNPAQAQKEATQEVAKKYSGTDASKGFVTDAVNHMDNVPPIKNMTAKARNFAKENNTPIELPPETLYGYLRTRVQDSAYRLGLVQKGITKRGGKISDEANAYMQREAYIGKAASHIGAFEQKLGMVAGNKTGLLMRARKDGITVEMLDEYVRAKAAKARNAKVASLTGGKVADGGSGLTNKQADEILDKYKDNSKIEEYAKEFRDVAINPRLQVLKEAGILTDDQITLITKGEPDYVPFKVEEFSRPQGGGKGFSVQSSGLKGIKGSARTDRTNAVMQSVTDYQEAVIRAEKNKSLQSLAKMIRENPDSTLWEIKGVTYTPQYNKYGELQFLRKNPINERTSVEFFENGKAFEIRFHDEALARVFTEQGVTRPIPGLIKINNYLRAVNTVINPEFMITNAIRDAQTAMVIAGGEKGVLVAAKMLKDYPSASKGIWQAVRKESNTGWSKIYNEMVENGGRTGWFDLKEVGETTRRTSKLVARYNSTKTSDALMRAVDSTGKLISDANEVFEMSIRTSAYKQLVDGGMSKVAAANYAKNMTVNFNKKGNWGMFLNSAYLFANAGIQGGARLLMAMKYPKVRRITYGIVGSAYALNELNMKINPEGYERVQDFEKERNLIVMLPLDGNKYDLPGISGDPANGYYFKMPLPYGFNVFKVAGDIAYDTVNKKKTSAEAIKTMLMAIDASFNPLSSGTATQFISPTVLDPFVASWENKNWFGAPIMPEQPAFAPAVRDSDRYFSGARDLSVGTAQFFNRLTGGNEVTAGAVDISPETIDHVIDTLGGGLGNFLAQFVDGSVRAVKGDIPTLDEMPFIRKLIDTPFETGEQSTVFQLLERSATNRMSQIEITRFADNAIRALERGQIDEKTAKRVLKDFMTNAVRQEAGEVLSLIEEGKIDKAIEVLQNAPPGIQKELEKIIRSDIEREIKKLERQQK